MEYKKDKDGNFLLDENNEKIPVELTDEQKEADAKLTAALAPLVEEVKELRLERGMLKDLLKTKEEITPLKPAEPVTEEEKLSAAIKKALDAEKSSNAQAAKRTAFEKFIMENKEFHPDNDSLGIKRDALQKKFAQFNTDGLSTVEEFTSVIGDAKRLLVGNDNRQVTTDGRTIIPQAPIPRNSLKPIVDQELSPKEIKLMETTGRSKEQLLKMKKNHPDMLEGLLEFVRD